MEVTLAGEEGPQTRYLSISSPPAQSAYFEFTKRMTGSAFCRTLDCLEAGTAISINGPLGRFTLDRAPGARIAFLSGGIGITPIHSICAQCAAQQEKVDIVLIYGNRSESEIPFRQELDDLQVALSSFRVVHVLEQAPAGWIGRTGRIDAAMIREEIPDYAQRTFFVCGPPGMVEAMTALLQESMGMAERQILTENFTGY